MFTPKTALFTFVATCALAMGACQPAEGPAERAAKPALDNAAAPTSNAGPEQGAPAAPATDAGKR